MLGEAETFKAELNMVALIIRIGFWGPLTAINL